MAFGTTLWMVVPIAIDMFPIWLSAIVAVIIEALLVMFLGTEVKFMPLWLPLVVLSPTVVVTIRLATLAILTVITSRVRRLPTRGRMAFRYRLEALSLIPVVGLAIAIRSTANRTIIRGIPSLLIIAPIITWGLPITALGMIIWMVPWSSIFPATIYHSSIETRSCMT